MSSAISVTLIIFVVYLFIRSRRVDRQYEKEEKTNAAHLDRISFLESLLVRLVIERSGALDLYDPDVQSILRRLIAAQRKYMETYGVDWEAGIAREEALLRDL